MKEKKLFIIGAILVVLGLILSYFFLIKKDDNKESGAEKFKSEYTNVTSDNPFVYRNVDQIINILEKGTGVVSRFSRMPMVSSLRSICWRSS